LDNFRWIWLTERGYYLLPLNIIVFLLISFPVLLVWSHLGLLILTYENLRIALGFQAQNNLSQSFRLSIRDLLQKLLWGLFPFLEEPIKFRDDSEPTLHVSLAARSFSVLYYLFFLFVLPTFSLTMDYILVKELNQAREAVYGEEKNKVLTWLILSSIACAGGTLGLGSILYLEGMFLRQMNRHQFFDHTHSLSPMAHPSKVPVPHLLARFFLTYVDELVQLLVVCRTAVYIGYLSRLWFIKYLLSVTVLSLNLSQLYTYFVFGKDIIKVVRYGIRFLYLLLFLSLFLTLTSFLIQDDYCSISRNVTNVETLVELKNCIRISAPTTISDLNLSTEVSFKLKSLP